MCAKSASITLPFNEVVVKVVEAKSQFKSYSSLTETLVLLDDVPPEFRNAQSMLAFCELVGKPIQVDDVFIGRLGSVCAQVWCRNHNRLKGFLEVYPASLGYRINLKVEPKEWGANPKASSSHNPEDQRRNERKGDDDPSNKDGPSLTEEEW